VSRRVAFLIGNQKFLPESGLAPLQGPTNDVAALTRVLGDPDRGQFEVHQFLDKPGYEILPDIERGLRVAAKEDLFLILYSGHGKRSRNGQLCLATAETRDDALRATSIPARYLTELVEESDCGSVILLLDCCYSGAVDIGLRGDISSELQAISDAQGFYIITASNKTQIARETELVPGGSVMGRFTAALVNGMESGSADRERKGKILLSDLRHYLGQVVTGQTPQFFARRAIGDPLISLSPVTAVPLLDAVVLSDLDAEQWHRRQGAVRALSVILRDGDAQTQDAVKEALRRRLIKERDYEVRVDLELALGLKSTSTSDIPRPVDLTSKTTAAGATHEIMKVDQIIESRSYEPSSARRQAAVSKPGHVADEQFQQPKPSHASLLTTAAHVTKISLESLPADKREMAQKVISAFAKAGFGTHQQAAALASAIIESDLNTAATSASLDNGIGLFQINPRNPQGGFGTGYTTAQLIDPDINIALTIRQSKKVSRFVNSVSVDDAIETFVRFVIRPQRPELAVLTARKLARQLVQKS
jgi:hypothetical protein